MGTKTVLVGPYTPRLNERREAWGEAKQVIGSPAPLRVCFDSRLGLGTCTVSVFQGDEGSERILIDGACLLETTERASFALARRYSTDPSVSHPYSFQTHGSPLILSLGRDDKSRKFTIPPSVLDGAMKTACCYAKIEGNGRFPYDGSPLYQKLAYYEFQIQLSEELIAQEGPEVMSQLFSVSLGLQTIELNNWIVMQGYKDPFRAVEPSQPDDFFHNVSHQLTQRHERGHYNPHFETLEKVTFPRAPLTFRIFSELPALEEENYQLKVEASNPIFRNDLDNPSEIHRIKENYYAADLTVKEIQPTTFGWDTSFKITLIPPDPEKERIIFGVDEKTLNEIARHAFNSLPLRKNCRFVREGKRPTIEWKNPLTIERYEIEIQLREETAKSTVSLGIDTRLAVFPPIFSVKDRQVNALPAAAAAPAAEPPSS